MEPSGNYPIERRRGEIERLRIQAEAVEFDAGVMLERIGVAPGWRCLDLGCGPGGILELLSERAGPKGRVVGLDADPVFLEHARTLGLGNLELVQGDAYRTGLPRASFDLVHARFLLSTAGRPEALIAEAIALTRPGGIVALEEPDIGSLRCHPANPAFERLTRLMEQLFDRVGGDVRLGQRLHALVRKAGLQDVHYRPFLVGFASGHPMTDFVPSTIESLRAAIERERLIEARELDATLAACRRHLGQPDTVFTYPTVAQVWGRTPA
jgi:ubiquinone/menaquinone biosynthesis C-methylase UbiE